MKYIKIKCLEITAQLKKQREDLQDKIATMLAEQEAHENSLRIDLYQLISDDEQNSVGISDESFNPVSFSDDIECVVIDPKIYEA